MVDDYTEVVVLCEDRQQEVFARSFLKEIGYWGKKVRTRTAAKGLGSGEQFVRTNFPEEVQTYRRVRNYKKIALVVFIDADTREVDACLRGFDDELIQNSLKFREHNERIAIIAPKRNIETWIHFLMGQVVDEETIYPKFVGNESICKPYVKQLAQRMNEALPTEAPNSMKLACVERKRIF